MDKRPKRAFVDGKRRGGDKRVEKLKMDRMSRNKKTDSNIFIFSNGRGAEEERKKSYLFDSHL